jgi:hypothetical protein
MEQGKDYRFDLSTFLKEQEQTKTKRLYAYQFQIEIHGCFTINLETESVKIYTPELAIVLASNEMTVLNLDTKTETVISGLDYLETYVKAYKEGEQYFESEFKVPQYILYTAEGEQYVRGIHENFFHTRHTGISEGWSYVKNSFPIILTHKNIKEFGYYSGIVNKVEELVKKHRFPFVKFERCEHGLPETVKLKATVLGLFCNLINKIGIDKRDEIESAAVFCKRICDKFKLPYTDRVRQNFNVNENKKLIKELKENVLPLIDNEAKVLIENYFSNKQPPKQTLYV